MLEDPMFAVVFILEYVIGEPVSDEDRKVGTTVIHLQFWAYGSWDSLFPISMGPAENL